LIRSRAFRDMMRRRNDAAHLYRRLVPVTIISTCRLSNGEQTSRSIKHGRLGVEPSSYLGGVGLDLMVALQAPPINVTSTAASNPARATSYSG